MIHEISNPLEALSHLTYLALQEPDDPDKVVRYMKMAEEQMANLNGIVSYGESIQINQTTVHERIYRNG